MLPQGQLGCLRVSVDPQLRGPASPVWVSPCRQFISLITEAKAAAGRAGPYRVVTAELVPVLS